MGPLAGAPVRRISARSGAGLVHGVARAEAWRGPLSQGRADLRWDHSQGGSAVGVLQTGVLAKCMEVHGLIVANQREHWLRAEALAAHTGLAQWRHVQGLPRAGRAGAMSAHPSLAQ